jgi:hypothetical protein
MLSNDMSRPMIKANPSPKSNINSSQSYTVSFIQNKTLHISTSKFQYSQNRHDTLKQNTDSIFRVMLNKLRPQKVNARHFNAMLAPSCFNLELWSHCYMQKENNSKCMRDMFADWLSVRSDKNVLKEQTKKYYSTKFYLLKYSTHGMRKWRRYI